MNYNLIAYGIFMLIVAYIIIVVGHICYRNGNIYVLSLIPGHDDLCIRINKILLMGYYLVNIGYAAMTLINWHTINSLPQLVEMIAFKTAIIISILCVLHYTNIFVLTNYVKKLI
jgi:hypothetical protein